jgi:hypothetical protein
MGTSTKTNVERRRTAGSLDAVVRQIADELLTVNYGHSSAETGDRLAIKKADGKTERDLGGRCRHSIEMVLRRHLSNSKINEPGSSN